MKPIVERSYDPEIPAAAAQRPQQIGVLGFARRYQPAVSHDDFGGEQIVASRPVKAHQPAITAAQGQSGNPTSESVPPGTAKPEVWVARSSSPHNTPAWARTVLPRTSISIAFINDRSMTSPPSQTAVPAQLCPPLRTAANSSRSLANRTAEATSAWFAQ